MSRTVTGTSTVGLVLTAASDNPVTVAAGGTIDTSDAAAIYGSGSIAWSLVNFGELSGSLSGVRLATDGTIANEGAILGQSTTSWGVYLAGGGTVTNGVNIATATIAGAYGIAIKSGTGTVANYGTIRATDRYRTGVYLAAGGAVTNVATGALLRGGSYAIDIAGGPGTVSNNGSISGGHPSYALPGDGVGGAIRLQHGGTVANGSLASIYGFNFGVSISGAAGTVSNAGVITTDRFRVSDAVHLSGGGSVTNMRTGTIAGPIDNYGSGIRIGGGGGTVTNAGTIGATGSLGSSGPDAIDFAPGYTNRLVIEPAAVFIGRVDGGNATDSSSVSTLELASGASQGTIAGLGSQFINFAQVTVDAAASWVFSEKNAISQAGLADDGTILLPAGASLSAFRLTVGQSATISVAGGHMLAGNGGFSIASSGTVCIANGGGILASEVDVDGAVTLQDAGSSMTVADILSVSGSITQGDQTSIDVHFSLGVGPGGRIGGAGALSNTDAIQNAGVLFAIAGNETVTANGIFGTGVLQIQTGGTLTINAGSVAATQTVHFVDGSGTLAIGTLDGFAAVIANYIPGDEIMVPGTTIAATSYDTTTHVLALLDGSGAFEGSLQFGASVTDGSIITVNGITPTPCFAAGTRIATERGEVCVESLRVGDRVQTLLGGTSAPLIWLGHRTVDCARHPEPWKVWPVCIAAHAFGPALPARDLHVSPDHALYVGDALIPVKHLINGCTIVQVPCDEVAYYHVELPRHSILLAEGLPAESYLETGGRGNFANGGSAIVLHPEFVARQWDAEACAPLAVTGPQLAAARQWLAAMATQLVRSDPRDMRPIRPGSNARCLRPAGRHPGQRVRQNRSDQHRGQSPDHPDAGAAAGHRGSVRPRRLPGSAGASPRDRPAVPPADCAGAARTIHPHRCVLSSPCPWQPG